MEQTHAFTVNGQPVTVRCAPRQPLLDVLRHELRLTATRLGCGLGQCGACRVMVDGQALAACETPMEAVQGRQVLTLEGLGTPQAPHPLQTAFIEEQAAQCGFCTSGMLMTAAALLRRQPHPTREEVQQALQDNLCRCGVHNRIVRAVLKAGA